MTPPSPAHDKSPAPIPKPLEKLPTIQDLVNQRLGTPVGGELHNQTLHQLADHILKKYAVRGNVAGEVIGMMWAADVRRLAGLIREKETATVEYAMDHSDGDYDKATFFIVQEGSHKAVDAHIVVLQCNIMRYEKQLTKLSDA